MLAEAIRRIARSAGDVAPLCRELEEQHGGRSILTRLDQLVYSETDPMTEVYLLTSGMVRLFAGDGSTSRTSLLLAAPALFGDRDILAGCSVSQESARSVSKATLLCFDRSELETTFERDEETRRLLTFDLLRRYARSIRFSGYLALPLEQRVLWLLYEHQRAGRGEVPAYESLALMTDSSLKSIGRAVRTLQDGGALAVDAARNFAIAPATLEELAETELIGLFHSITP